MATCISFGQHRLGGGLALALLAVLACDSGGAHKAPPPATPAAAPLGAHLGAALLEEIDFVPPTTRAFVRVDLAKLAATAPGAGAMLDYLLRAQQPAVADVLAAAGLVPGREIAAAYLILGEDDELVVAGVGRFDAARIASVLAGREAEVALRPDGARTFTWRDGVEPYVGAAVAFDSRKALLGPASVGVAEGLVLVGSPAAVGHCLDQHGGATAGGASRSLAVSPLAKVLASVDVNATLFGVARGGGPLVSSIAPGLVSARLSVEVAALGRGGLALEATFEEPPEAQSFAVVARGLAEEATRLIGGVAREAKDGAQRPPIEVTVGGATVSVTARLGQ